MLPLKYFCDVNNDDESALVYTLKVKSKVFLKILGAMGSTVLIGVRISSVWFTASDYFSRPKGDAAKTANTASTPKRSSL